MPRQGSLFSPEFVNVREGVLFAFVPKDGPAKNQAEGQVVHQRFQCAGRSISLRKESVHPDPVCAMTIAAVMALEAESQRSSFEAISIECDVSGENRIRMRRSRETDPAFVA